MERLGGGRPSIGTREVASFALSALVLFFVSGFGPASLVSRLIVHHVVLIFLVVALNGPNLDLHRLLRHWSFNLTS